MHFIKIADKLLNFCVKMALNSGVCSPTVQIDIVKLSESDIKSLKYHQLLKLCRKHNIKKQWAKKDDLIKTLLSLKESQLKSLESHNNIVNEEIEWKNAQDVLNALPFQFGSKENFNSSRGTFTVEKDNLNDSRATYNLAEAFNDILPDLNLPKDNRLTFDIRPEPSVGKNSRQTFDISPESSLLKIDSRETFDIRPELSRQMFNISPDSTTQQKDSRLTFDIMPDLTSQKRISRLTFDIPNKRPPQMSENDDIKSRETFTVAKEGATSSAAQAMKSAMLARPSQGRTSQMVDKKIKMLTVPKSSVSSSRAGVNKMRTIKESPLKISQRSIAIKKAKDCTSPMKLAARSFIAENRRGSFNRSKTNATTTLDSSKTNLTSLNSSKSNIPSLNSSKTNVTSSLNSSKTNIPSLNRSKTNIPSLNSSRTSIPTKADPAVSTLAAENRRSSLNRSKTSMPTKAVPSRLSKPDKENRLSAVRKSVGLNKMDVSLPVAAAGRRKSKSDDPTARRRSGQPLRPEFQTPPLASAVAKKASMTKRKVPDFAAIHQRQFQKMDSLDTYIAKKEERAKKLFGTPHQVDKVLKTANYCNQLEEVKEEKLATSTVPQAEQMNLTSAKTKKVTTAMTMESARKLVNKNPNLKTQTEVKDKTRSHIHSVRTNRRFELQKKFRNM